ncbi:hypothetical protein FIBSPDRAFT_912432 [Athelia psychrophila]|uniref:Uncharacterized protein n=1 Tax=Athelia psychrophila TaxID=1759441 RepID=A0A166ECB2_9AGAM|nr:hypothetical protein FIBSPDRAFT_912432 [Fibularhizoctonia sp. CBS 109695]
MDKENANPITGQKRTGSALLYPLKKRASQTDPIVRYGKHFGRTISAVTDIVILITNGLDRLANIEEGTTAIENLPLEERREHDIFLSLLKLVPKLDERLIVGTTEEVGHVSDMLQKGVNTARADDTKGIKSAIIDWITPRDAPLNPPLARNIKSDRGYHHERTGQLLCPAAWNWADEETKKGLRTGELAVPGEHWPLFVYENYTYDHEHPFNGLFKSAILVSAYKHIFTSPSSVDHEPKATRSGNARINGMSEVTMASIAYVATQVRFALSSTSTFSRTDYVTDSERFYNTVMLLFTDIRARTRINDIKAWWDQYVH